MFEIVIFLVNGSSLPNSRIHVDSLSFQLFGLFVEGVSEVPVDPFGSLEGGEVVVVSVVSLLIVSGHFFSVFGLGQWVNFAVF